MAVVHHSRVWRTGIGSHFSTKPPEQRQISTLREAHHEIGQLVATVSPSMWRTDSPWSMKLVAMLCVNSGLLERVAPFLPTFRKLHTSPVVFDWAIQESYHDVALTIAGDFATRVEGLCLPDDWQSLSGVEFRDQAAAIACEHWSRLQSLYRPRYDVDWERLIGFLTWEYGKAAEVEAAALKMPDGLTPTQQDIWRLVVEIGHRMTTDEILAELERRDMPVGGSAIKQHLALFTKRLKVWDNRQPAGYGFPHWQS